MGVVGQLILSVREVRLSRLQLLMGFVTHERGFNVEKNGISVPLYAVNAAQKLAALPAWSESG